MRQLPKAKTRDEVDFVFEQLMAIDDEKINGRYFNLFEFVLFILLLM